jgi:hypothetical protein
MLIYCVSCGNVNHSNKFCTKCGTALKVIKDCPECNYKVVGKEKKFCPQCGLDFIKHELDEAKKIQEEEINIARKKILRKQRIENFKKSKISRVSIVVLVSSTILVILNNNLELLNLKNSSIKQKNIVKPTSTILISPNPNPKMNKQSTESMPIEVNEDPNSESNPKPSDSKVESPKPSNTTQESKPNIINVGGDNIDLNKTKICLSIFQPMGFEPDTYCFKDSPKVGNPQGYVEQKYISGYSVPLKDLITLTVPFEKAPIQGCTLKYISFIPKYFTSGISEELVYGTTTYTLNYDESKISEFCKKYGDFKYGYSIKPIYNVLPFVKSQKLPLDFTFKIQDGNQIVNMIWTWSK